MPYRKRSRTIGENHFRLDLGLRQKCPGDLFTTHELVESHTEEYLLCSRRNDRQRAMKLHRSGQRVYDEEPPEVAMR